MDIANLVKMGNQIATFFEAMPDREQALKDIALHLKRFWAPPMRVRLMEHFRQGGADGMQPVLLAALEKHGDVLN